MKWSNVLHVLSVVSGFIGFLMLVGAWYSKGGFVAGMSEAHLFNDAQIWFLMAIWFAITALIHQKIEKNA